MIINIDIRDKDIQNYLFIIYVEMMQKCSNLHYHRYTTYKLVQAKQRHYWFPSRLIFQEICIEVSKKNYVEAVFIDFVHHFNSH